MEWITEPEVWTALATLLLLEIVLGVDNVVFISILADKLPEDQRERARRVGLGLAMLMRILLLLSISWVVQLTDPLFAVFGKEISGRDLILLLGGLFLLWKSTHEMHGQLEGDHGEVSKRVAASFRAVIAQILLLDIVFSLDSVITAIGMADDIGVMITAVVIAVAFMFFFARAISGFVARHPTVKMLALSFLLLIGVSLVADGLGFHIPKGYIYFSMAFSLFVEVMNIRLRRPKQAPVQLHAPYTDAASGPGQAPSETASAGAR